VVAKIFEMPHIATLNEKETKFVAALLACPTLEAACKRLHISHETGRRYLAAPHVKKAYESACQQVFAVELSRLQKSVRKAITFLEETLESDDPNPSATKVRAASILLSTAIEVNKNSEFDKRLAELESRSAKGDMNGAIK